MDGPKKELQVKRYSLVTECVLASWDEKLWMSEKLSPKLGIHEHIKVCFFNVRQTMNPREHHVVIYLFMVSAGKAICYC